MPAVFTSDVIDLVTITSDGKAIQLWIVQDEPWSGSEDQVVSLQDKINNYLSFALDGQLQESYPDAAGRSWRIVVHCQSGPPDSTTAEFLSRVSDAVADCGGELLVLED